MLKPGGGLDFLQKPIDTERGRQVRAEHLDRDLAAVANVVREVDRRHAALPQLTLEHVAVTQGINKLWGWCGHRTVGWRRLECVAHRA
jgi:hypothetical protein